MTNRELVCEEMKKFVRARTDHRLAYTHIKLTPEFTAVLQDEFDADALTTPFPLVNHHRLFGRELVIRDSEIPCEVTREEHSSEYLEFIREDKDV